MNHWINNAIATENEKEVLVDLGYITSEGTRNRAERLETMVGKKNFEVEMTLRLLVHIPPTKVRRVLAAFPIQEGAKYFACTHSWLDEVIEAT